MLINQNIATRRATSGKKAREAVLKNCAGSTRAVSFDDDAEVEDVCFPCTRAQFAAKAEAILAAIDDTIGPELIGHRFQARRPALIPAASASAPPDARWSNTVWAAE